MKKDRLRVGVVGLKIGDGHVADYKASASVEEVVICDLDERQLNEVGDRHGVKKRYTDLAAMLATEKLDAVSICLPNKLHMPMTIQAIEAGCHVLCEKPMARNAEEAEQMLNASRKHGKKLMINFNQRFEPFRQILKGMIDDGDLGDIYFSRTLWHRRRGVPWWYPLAKGKEMCGGGPLIDLGVHVLDRAMWLCGFPEPEWVLGNTFCKISGDEAKKRGLPGFELEDMGVAMIRMKNGAMLELEASWAANRKDEEITTQLYGSKGGAFLRYIGGGTEYHELYLDVNGRQHNVQLDPRSIKPVPTIRQLFLDSILNDTEVPCTPEQGLVINKILDAVYQSAETKGPVRVC
ncbi:MAG: Gfo/Idh/MocA family oxidoreductase [Verrucomicrobiae bacterium]